MAASSCQQHPSESSGWQSDGEPLPPLSGQPGSESEASGTEEEKATPPG